MDVDWLQSTENVPTATRLPQPDAARQPVIKQKPSLSFVLVDALYVMNEPDNMHSDDTHTDADLNDLFAKGVIALQQNPTNPDFPLLFVDLKSNE